MNQLPKSITLDLQAARRLMLVQAIETCDTQGKLISPVEREEIDQLARASVENGSPAGVTTAQVFLHERAQQVLRVVENRNPALASLQTLNPWTRWLALAAFFAAVIFGAATDRIANPHRVDLLSLPLLAIIVWNIAMYCILFARYLLQRRRHRPHIRPAPAIFMRWADGLRSWHRRSGQLRASVTALFMRNWYGATATLQAQRWRKVLHLAAAGWALGLVLSLFTRGLVVEYRVGWESTFLDASQVHAILRVLLMPAMALFPFQPFTVQDIESLRFGDGTGALAGARWVYIYATLLAVLVIVPRIVLAWYAGWREQVLSRHVVLALADPYYRRLLAMLNPTRIQLGLLALRDEDREALLRVLRPSSPTPDAAAGSDGSPQTLIRSSSGESLCIAHIALARKPLPPPQAVNAPARSWAARMFVRLLNAHGAEPAQTGDSPVESATDDSDAVLLVVRSADDLESARPFLHGSGEPALLLVVPDATTHADREAAVALCCTKARASGLRAEVLGFDRFARCWVQDPILLDALARCLPGHKKEAFARLADAWLKRNDALFAESMQVIATQLLDAAREVEEMPGALPYLKRLTSLVDRQADAQARKDAIAAIAERLQHAARQSNAQLLRLHGIDDAQGMLLEQPLKVKFDFQVPVNAREAGLAGAATGAASGASIDLVTGGLTLGAAAALGALIGGGAAFAGAAWKNRATPGGTTLVQLSDEMLLAMAAAAMLRYLVTADFVRGATATRTGKAAALWESKVAAAIAVEKESLVFFWAEVRMRQGGPQTTVSFAGKLQKIVRFVLDELYLAGPAKPVQPA